MSEVFLYIVILLFLVLCSAFFSGTEVAMFSLRTSDRELMARSLTRRDKLILRLLSSPRRLLATILIGNESVNVAISAVMAGFIERTYNSGSATQDTLVAILCALPLLLFFGEITPKSIAIESALSWSRSSVRVLWLFGLLVSPIRVVVRIISDLVLGPHTKESRDISEEEFKVLVDAGSKEGQVDDRERRLIHNVFEFGDKTVASAMQPKSSVFALAYELPMSRLVKEVAARGYSRIPIYHRSTSNILGVLYAKDLVIASSQPIPGKLSELLHKPLFIPQTTPLENLFGIFKQGETHIALVVNEYGDLVGIVTMEDLLEELFGEIRDEREFQQASAYYPRHTTSPGIVTESLATIADEEPEQKNSEAGETPN